MELHLKLKVGDKAPDFSLKNTSLENVRLSDFRGMKNVLLLFFPLVNSDTCETELCTINDGLSQYQYLDAQILAISVDSHFALKLWEDKFNFKFTLLTDFNKEVCRLYDAFYEVFVPGIFDYKGVAKRSAFIIDKSGVLQYIEVLDDARNQPDFHAIKNILAKLS